MKLFSRSIHWNKTSCNDIKDGLWKTYNQFPFAIRKYSVLCIPFIVFKQNEKCFLDLTDEGKRILSKEFLFQKTCHAVPDGEKYIYIPRFRLENKVFLQNLSAAIRSSNDALCLAEWNWILCNTSHGVTIERLDNAVYCLLKALFRPTPDIDFNNIVEKFLWI